MSETGPVSVQGRRVNVTEVALAAGVSPMTVSRVANGQRGVAERTREHVLDVMTTMGYRPNHSARALRIGRSGILGVICLSSTFHGPSQVMFGVEQAARREGFATVILALNHIDKLTLLGAVRQLRQSAVEGIIVISPLTSGADALRGLSSDLPTLAIWAPSGVGVAVTGMNHAAAASHATRHLLDLGHPNVWHISGPLDWTGSEQRLAGWRQELLVAGKEPPPVFEGDWTAHSGYDAGLRMLLQTDATAVFTANDQMALGVYRAAHELRRQIPTDLSVVGYDDGPDSAYYTPPLTTVHQNFESLGARAFATIHATMAGLDPQSEPGIVADETPLLVVRDSSAPYVACGS